MKEFKFQLAETSHIEPIWDIASFWLEKGKSGDFSKGSFSNILSIAEIKILIEDLQVVVTLYENEVVGYYLSNSLFVKPYIEQRKRIIENLICNRVLPNGRYVYQMHAAVKESFLGNGLSIQMLNRLKTILHNRFDYLSGILSEENYQSVYKQHLKAGWEIIGKFNVGYIAIMSTNSLPIKSMKL